MWHSWIEIERYSALVKNEVNIANQGLGLPPIVHTCHHYSLLVRDYSYAHESGFTSGCYTEYTRGTIITVNGYGYGYKHGSNNNGEMDPSSKMKFSRTYALSARSPQCGSTVSLCCTNSVITLTMLILVGHFPSSLVIS